MHPKNHIENINNLLFIRYLRLTFVSYLLMDRKNDVLCNNKLYMDFIHYSVSVNYIKFSQQSFKFHSASQGF